MPVKNVYGKKAKRSTFITSAAFGWSSSPENRRTRRDDRPQNVDDIAQSLDALKLAEKRLAESKEDRQDISAGQPKGVSAAALRREVQEARPQTPPPKERRVLTEKNGNAVVQRGLGTTALPRSSKTTDAVRKSPRLAKKREQQDGTRDCEGANEQQLGIPQSRFNTESPIRHLGLYPQLERHDSLLEPEAYVDPHLEPLLRLVTDAEARKAPLSFAAWTDELSNEFSIAKMAEASYAQVYLLSRKEPTGLPNEDHSIFKIISLNPPALSECPSQDKRPQKVRETSSDIAKVASEVRLLDRMTEIPGFTNLREIRVLKGRPTAPFISAWKEWNKSRRKGDKSFFPDPSRKTNYEEEQLWAVIEMDHAGLDLEHQDMHIDSIWALWDVFWGVAIALAKGEEEVRFEHRDLHLGNICIVQPDLAKHKPNARVKLGFTGFETTIIDYTLSRAELQRDMNKGQSQGEVVFTDLEKEGIFDGDESVNYQYEIYRLMRSAVFHNDPEKEYNEKKAKRSGKSWRGSHLGTNLLWLYFILHSLYSDAQKNNEGFEMLLVQNDASCTKETLRRKRKELDLCISLLIGRLNPMCWKYSGLSCVRDLISLALNQGWLDVADVRDSRAGVGAITQSLSDLAVLDQQYI